MFPPVPAAFAGSMPQDYDPQTSAPAKSGAPGRVPRLLDRSFFALALLAGSSATAGALLARQDLAWPDITKLACAATLVPALLGMWLMEQVQEAPSLAVTRIYSLVQKRLADGSGRTAVSLHPDEGAYGGLAGLIAGSVVNLRRLQAGRIRAQASGHATNQALRAGRDQATRLATRLRQDAVLMGDAASGMMVASARLVEDAAATRQTSDATERSVSHVVDRAASLATAVTTITTQINRMSKIAVCASEAAFSAQTRVAGLCEKTASLSLTADQVAQALQLATACARGAAPATATLVTTITDAEAALANMSSIIAALRGEAVLAGERMAELSDQIREQHALGDALSHAVAQQGTEITLVLTLLHDAHTGFAKLRDGVDAITRHGADRQAEAETVRGAANLLPAHADTIASILRAIPDFAPPMEF